MSLNRAKISSYKIKKLMEKLDAMKEWLENKRKEFNALPEGK